MNDVRTNRALQKISMYVRKTIDSAEMQAKQQFPGASIEVDLPVLPEGLTPDRLGMEIKLSLNRQPSLYVVFDQLSAGTDPKAIFQVRQR